MGHDVWSLAINCQVRDSDQMIFIYRINSGILESIQKFLFLIPDYNIRDFDSKVAVKTRNSSIENFSVFSLDINVKSSLT